MSDYKQLLDGLESVLGVIGGVTSLPGVDLIPYVGTVSKFIGYAQAAIGVGKKIGPDVEDFVATFSEGLPSEEKRAALDARIEANHKAIQDFNPVAEAGEEE